jgi:hypothetical protein
MSEITEQMPWEEHVRDMTEPRPGEHAAYVYHVLHADDMEAQRRFGTDDWPAMHLFQENDGNDNLDTAAL